MYNYADDQDLETVITKLEQDSLSEIMGFENNYMKLNDDKCHCLILGSTYEYLWFKIDNAIIL